MLRKLAGFVAAAGMVVTVACGQTDSGITASVKNRMAADDSVKAYQVNVDTRNHVIDQLRVNETAATSGIGGDLDGPDVDIAVKDDLEANVDHSAEAAKTTAEKGARAMDVLKSASEKGLSLLTRGRLNDVMIPSDSSLALRVKPFCGEPLSECKTSGLRIHPSAKTAL